MWVAEVSGNLVGVLQAELWDTPAQPTLAPALRCHISDLVVLRAWRRRGIGRLLVQAASDWASEHGASALVLTVWHGNRAARRFYRALGCHDVAHVMKLDL